LGILAERFDIKIIECDSDGVEVATLVSLKPTESIAGCASKLKGQAIKWLREALRQDQPSEQFGKGYFAATSGKNTADQVGEYLAGQGEHHGYSQRVVPPVFVETYAPSPACDDRLQPAHACALLRFHIVLTIWRRQGVFGRPEAEAVARCWRKLETEHKFAMLKVSFVPDHVHLAVRLHTSVAPAAIVVALMNAAQALLSREFARSVIEARVERVWQPGAYIGSFGDLATPQVQAYLKRWRSDEGGAG
jgi:REP element-mobilizing transposase RayT